MKLKSAAQIRSMRAAGRLVARAHEIVAGLMTPGVTTAEIDRQVEAFFLAEKATPLFKGVPGPTPYPAVTCISVNSQVVHGIPGPRKLVAGDIVSVDTGCRLQGWCGDAAWTYPVGDTSPARQRICEVGAAVLNLAIAEMRPGRWWSEIAAQMEALAVEAGFSVVKDFVGHGLGREMHEDPEVPNFTDDVHRASDFQLKPGLVLAVEPMLTAGRPDVGLLEDRWTVRTVDHSDAVHFEHTVAVTADGAERLTVL